MRVLLPLPITLIAATLLVSGCVRNLQPKRPAAPSCWSELTAGFPYHQDAEAVSSTLSLDAGGGSQPWLTWSEENQTVLLHWTGQTWQKIPAPTSAEDPILRVSAAGAPFLAWRERSSKQSRVMVSTWDGRSWKNLGQPLDAHPEDLTDSGELAFVLDEGSRPVVVWGERPVQQAMQLFAARWAGDRWERLGESVPAGTSSVELDPAITIDGAGRIWIAWTQGDWENAIVRVARWNQGAWEDIETSATGALGRGTRAFSPRLLQSGNEEMLVVWLELKERIATLRTARWIGDDWKLVPPPPSSRDAWSPSLVVGSAGHPILAWSHDDGAHLRSISVQRLTPEGWEPVKEALHLDAGESDVYAVQMARGAEDDLYLAWNERGNDGRVIRTMHLKQCHENETPTPLPPLLRRDSFWPKSVDEAVDRLVAELDEASKERARRTSKDERILFHHGWGTGIRNGFGLWRGNSALLESCAEAGAPVEEEDGEVHPDSCSTTIIEHVWERLQRPSVEPDQKGK